MAINETILELIEQTPFVDTHEHLIDESSRVHALRDPKPGKTYNDFGVFFSHYSESDLVVAGMDAADVPKLGDPGIHVQDKWRLVAPFYEAARHTGYLQCVRESIRQLFAEDDLRADNCKKISDRIAAQIRPGFYEHILRDVANIEYAQVNSVESVLFHETEQPDLLAQDISIVPLSTGLDINALERLTEREVGSLRDWHEIIDWCFATYGHRAVAVKNQSAYRRRLDFDTVDAEDAAPLFKRLVLSEGNGLTEQQHKAIEDHLFHYCVKAATRCGLPIKLHTGYCAGVDGMRLDRVRKNASDLCPVLQEHPKARFVIMHMGYPYQDEAIALAKQYSNAYIDMCWAWIINPLAAVRFVKEFLAAAPANKLLTFGGDFIPVEMVPGHARIARRGLAQALSELIYEGWIDSGNVEDLIARLMHGNAHALFDHQGALQHWETPSILNM